MTGAAQTLSTQTQARREARDWNEQNYLDNMPLPLVAIAVPWPLNTWGGHEKGWTVLLKPSQEISDEHSRASISRLPDSR